MMKIYDDFEIDYEHLDDLPLSEHIEWNHLESDVEIDIEPLEEKEQSTQADNRVALDKFRDFIFHKSDTHTANQ